jgi:hypothetical protein
MKRLLDFENNKDFILNVLPAYIFFVFFLFLLINKIIFLLICILFIGIYLYLNHIWRDSLYVFTKEEWKRLAQITAIREGSSSLDSEIQNYHILKGMENALFACELKSSICKLDKTDQYVILGSDGNVISSPWTVTKQNYLNPIKENKSPYIRNFRRGYGSRYDD